MTEAEWLASDDPAAMLRYLMTGRPEAEGAGANYPLRPCPVVPTDRKLRLFACACVRQVWHLLTDDAPCGRCEGKGYLSGGWAKVAGVKMRMGRSQQCSDCGGTGRISRSRRAVEVAERYADGEATEEERRLAYENAGRVVVRGEYATLGPFEAEIAWKCCGPIEVLTANNGLPSWFSVSTKQAATQAALLRCLFGNPFRPVGFTCDSVRGEFLSWQGGTIPRLAAAIYDSREWDRLPILADALEEAGCDNEDMLWHLRGWDQCNFCGGKGKVKRPELRGGPRSGPTKRYVMEPPSGPVGCVQCHGDGWVRGPGLHARGCWVLDLLLGRE